jgi:TRAP-type mannitol/chloroaromatic compound transport system permease small subunit
VLLATVFASLVIIALALDRIERKVGRAAVTQLVLVMLVIGSSLLLMRKLAINGAGLIWFGAS